MECPKCQHENPEDARFCMGCGRNLILPSEPSSKALSFDEKLDKIQRYLPKGLTEKILSQKDKIEGERKQVTVMFCDMEGFTSLVEEVGPEEAYSVMDQVYEILIHNVHDFEGTVNEMTGDGIMALFGAPIALEDAPQRALRSALSIHGEIAKFNDQKKGIKPIKMRIGVHTGPVVVGSLGNDLRLEFKAVGDTVNLSSRMEGLAAPGTTYVTEDTFTLTEGLFRFEALGVRKVKGKKEAVRVYKVLSAKEDVYRPRLGFERMIYSEMVGRDKELNKLELQVTKVINGEGSIVNIIGEAGIGKSRLVAELKNREVIKQVALFEGRANSIGKNLGFHPIIDLFKQWARIREDDSEAVALSKLETAVRRVHPEEMHEVLPFVATLMRIKLSGRYAERVKGIEGDALERLILKNVRDLLIKATELTPLVIVTEDLHWADMSSIEFMESLFRLSETKRILFANVFRPGHKETGDKIVKTIKEMLPEYYVEIVLQPLDERMSETLINNMLNIKGLQHAVMDQIVERSGGNPFFIEEVVRSFIDEGAIVPKDAAFEVTEKIDTMVIPHTINDVLMARIDRLEEKTRNLVKVASVIGRSFFYRILTEVARTIEDIDNRLSYLKEIQFIRERMRMEELEYLFKHALAQEAAYESILERKRKELHLKVAGSIERVFIERLHEFYGMLAFHYSRGEDEEKTEEYLIKAGEEALRASASNEALYYYRQALNRYLNQHGDAADPEHLASFERGIAVALFNKGQFANAIDYFDSVFERWGVKFPKNTTNLKISLIYNLIGVLIHLYFPWRKARKIPSVRDNDIFELHYMRGSALNYVDSLRFVWEIFRGVNKAFQLDISRVVIGHAVFPALSLIFSVTGMSFKLGKRSLEYSKNFIDIKNYGHLILYNLCDTSLHVCEGSWDQITDYDEELVNQSCRVGFVNEAGAYIWGSTIVKIEQGRFSEAKTLIEKLSGIWRDYEHSAVRVFQYLLEANLSMKSRKLFDSLIKIDEAVDFADRSGIVDQQVQLLSIKGGIQMLLKDMDGAKESLLQADNIIRERKYFLNWFTSEYLIGQFVFNILTLEEVALSNDRHGILEYRKKTKRSGKAAKKTLGGKYAVGRTEFLKLMGLYYWLIGRQSMALKWWSKSIAEGERLGARPDLSRTYMEVGKRLLEARSKFRELNGIRAEEFLQKAKTMFHEMDLQWDLDELDRIAAYG